MIQGNIQRLARDRVDLRHDARLPTAWIGNNAPAPAWTGGTWLTRMTTRPAYTGNAPILALLGDGGEEARAALLAYAGSGARVYALVGPMWGKGQVDAQMLQTPRVLVRRLPEVPASAVYVGGEARLWIGGGFALRLDGDQAEALRQTFLRLFWHDATEEAWSGGPQFAWRPARERPFDVPEVPSVAAVRWASATERLSGDVRGSLMHIAAGPPPDIAPRRLWYPAGPDHHERLARLVQTGDEVVWTQRGLPDILVTNTGGEILLPGTRGRLRLRLSPDQTGEVSRLLEAPPVWQFHTSVRLGDPPYSIVQFWLSGEPTARPIEPEQRIKVPDVQAISLRAVPETVPTSVTPAQPLALTVRYQWTVLPPRVPSGTEEDALIGRWRQMDTEWKERLSKVREALVAADGERGRIGKAFTRLMGAMLGFGRTHADLLARVGGLEAQRPSVVGPSGALTLFAQLEQIESESRKHKDDLDEAERKVREDLAREEQQATWQKRVDTAKESLPLRRIVLKTAEGRLKVAQDSLQSIEQSLKSNNGEGGADHLANQKKVSDEVHRIGQEIARLRGEIEALDRQANERFEFRPPPAPLGRPAQPSGRFVPPAPSARPVVNLPSEALPEVGNLRSHQGQRYLVIQNWEYLGAGEQAASRLSARLVAPESA